MLKTEEEAEKTVCCGPWGIATVLAFIAQAQGVKAEFQEGAGHCGGSKCAAWRWADWSKDEAGFNKLPLRGYCGLAGKPE